MSIHLPAVLGLTRLLELWLVPIMCVCILYMYMYVPGSRFAGPSYNIYIIDIIIIN